MSCFQIRTATSAAAAQIARLTTASDTLTSNAFPFIPVLSSRPAWTHDARPPHERAGDEHRRRRHTEQRPHGFRRLVAQSRATARDADAVDPPEVQIRQPVDDLVA